MSYLEMEQSLEAALIQDSESDYTLAPKCLSCWITVDSLSVYLKRDGDYLIVEVFPVHQEDEAAIASIEVEQVPLTPPEH